MFDAEFTDIEPLPSGVPSTVVEEICLRTPGFTGWQQERWLFHCNDGAAFMGRAGWSEIDGHDEAIAMLLADGWHADVLSSISREGDLTAYLFRCLHCGVLLAYADAA